MKSRSIIEVVNPISITTGAFTLEMREISKLKSAPYQPDSRTEPRLLRSLHQAIQQSKLVYPIIILRNGMIVDGHRRVAVLKTLGIEKVECLVYMGKIPPARLFITLQEATRKVTSNEWCKIYAYSGMLPTSPQTASEILMLEELFGKPSFKKAIGEGLSTALLKGARAVELYLKLSRDKKSRKKLMLWMWENHMMERARWWAYSGGNKNTLLAAIDSNSILPELSKRNYVPQRQLK